MNLMFLVTRMHRLHAGIDEMDVFFNIDLNNFLDVR